MTNDHKTNFAMIIITIITIAIIIIAIFAYNYTNVFKKYNTYNLDTKEILSYNDTLTGVELVTFMNKIDNINRKNKDRYKTDKYVEESNKNRKSKEQVQKQSEENNYEDNYLKISVKILMPNEKYNPMSLSRAEKDKIEKEENKEKKEKTEEKYVTLDMEKILKNGVTNFIELFGTSRFKRQNIIYYGNSNGIKEIIYLKDGDY